MVRYHLDSNNLIFFKIEKKSNYLLLHKMTKDDRKSIKERIKNLRVQIPKSNTPFRKEIIIRIKKPIKLKPNNEFRDDNYNYSNYNYSNYNYDWNNGYAHNWNDEYEEIRYDTWIDEY